MPRCASYRGVLEAQCGAFLADFPSSMDEAEWLRGRGGGHAPIWFISVNTSQYCVISTMSTVLDPDEVPGGELHGATGPADAGELSVVCSFVAHPRHKITFADQMPQVGSQVREGFGEASDRLLELGEIGAGARRVLEDPESRLIEPLGDRSLMIW